MSLMEPPVRPIEWCEDKVKIIDQRRLPAAECMLDLRTAEDVARAIKTMALRGAPLIGIAAAMGVALESRRLIPSTYDEFKRGVIGSIKMLRATRPTASNLFWALDRMGRVMKEEAGVRSPQAASEALTEEALRIYDEDLKMGIALGEIGVGLIKDGFCILTHCNAGGLATSGFGTALAPVYRAASAGLKVSVFADETRPLLQGARLTAWELARAGIDVTVICDSAAHMLLARKEIDLVLVGADRITLSGDFANKIGTYGVAVSAGASDVPFYVVAPTSTIDFDLEMGRDIPIEERDASEVTHVGGDRVTPPGVSAYNPAFDVTPADYVSGFITEKGLIRPPYEENLARIRP